MKKFFGNNSNQDNDSIQGEEQWGTEVMLHMVSGRTFSVTFYEEDHKETAEQFAKEMMNKEWIICTDGSGLERHIRTKWIEGYTPHKVIKPRNE